MRETADSRAFPAKVHNLRRRIGDGLEDVLRARASVAKLLDAPAAIEPGATAGLTIPTDRELMKARAHHYRDGEIWIMVIGETGRGKTTLVDALLGQVALPIGSGPCTPSLVEIRHGNQERSFIYRRGDTMPEAVSEQDLFDQWAVVPPDNGPNPPPEQALERIILYRSAQLLREGVVLLDTPGLNDLPERSGQALLALGKADIVLLVLSADTSTPTERRLIENELRRMLGPGRWPGLLAIWNRWDIVADDKMASTDRKRRMREIEQFEEQFLLEHIAPEQILRVSALDALKGMHERNKDIIAKSGWPQLSAAIAHKIEEMLSAQGLIHTLDQASAHLHRALDESHQAQQAATPAEAALQLEKYQQLSLDLKYITAKIRSLLKLAFADIKQLLRTDYPPFLVSIEEKLRAAGRATERTPMDWVDVSAVDMKLRVRSKINEAFVKEYEDWLGPRETGAATNESAAPDTEQSKKFRRMVFQRVEQLRKEVDPLLIEYANWRRAAVQASAPSDDNIQQRVDRLSSDLLSRDKLIEIMGKLTPGIASNKFAELLPGILSKMFDETAKATLGKVIQPAKSHASLIVDGITVHGAVILSLSSKPSGKTGGGEKAPQGGQAPSKDAAAPAQPTAHADAKQPTPTVDTKHSPPSDPEAKAPAAAAPDAKQVAATAPDAKAAAPTGSDASPASPSSGTGATDHHAPGSTGDAGAGASAGGASDASHNAGFLGSHTDDFIHGAEFVGGAFVIAAVGQYANLSTSRTTETEALVGAILNSSNAYLSGQCSALDQEVMYIEQQLDALLLAPDQELNRRIARATELRTTLDKRRQEEHQALETFKQRVQKTFETLQTLRTEVEDWREGDMKA